MHGMHGMQGMRGDAPLAGCRATTCDVVIAPGSTSALSSPPLKTFPQSSSPDNSQKSPRKTPDHGPINGPRSYLGDHRSGMDHIRKA